MVNSKKIGQTTTEQQMKMVDKRLRPLQPGFEDYKRVAALMNANMNDGLSESSDFSADLKMYITYVNSLPDRTEVGKFLALDLGGTNFRVLLIDLVDGKVELKCKVYAVDEKTMIGPGEGLFDHIAACIHQFLEAEGIENEQLPLGFTFSFPCSQEGLNVSRLVNWTKGFKCAGVEGQDVVGLLHQAVLKQNLNVHCVAVINDTVGTMLACAHLDQDCHIGIIFGTGTNACYMEDTAKIDKWKNNDSSNQVIVNTEWGAFGNSGCLGFLVTEYDRAVDLISKNPKEQIYEKMISGMYLGEVARQVIVKLVEDGCLFKGQLSEKLNTPMMFYTKYISEIESEGEHEVANLNIVLDELDIFDYSLTDCMIMKKICKVVSTRAAHLSAAGVAALLGRVNKSCVTVAIDGSLFRYHPTFHKNMREMTEKLAPCRKFNLKLSNDGSGIGAALVAAVSTRQDVCSASV